jgi:hypothetical protein
MNYCFRKQTAARDFKPYYFTNKVFIIIVIDLLEHSIISKSIVYDKPGSEIEDGCVAEENHGLHKRKCDAK